MQLKIQLLVIIFYEAPCL